MSDSDQLLLFFGEDLDACDPATLQRYHENGHILVPLNASAVGRAGNSGAPFVPLESYMGIDAFIQARQDADRWAAEWFLPVEELLTSSRICWPRFDRETMHWFWRDVAVASQFISAFMRRGAKGVELYVDQNPRPGLYYYASDTHAVLLKAILGGRARLIARPKTGKGLQPLRTLGIGFEAKAQGPSAAAGEIKGKIVLALNPGECHRFKPVIRDLLRHFPDRVAVVMLFPNLAEAAALKEAFSIPVVVPHSTEKMALEFVGGFQEGYKKLLNACRHSELGDILRHLEYHFAYYWRYRWPVMDGNFNAWNDLWISHRPDAVIVSSVPDGESQLPAEAARRIRIPTFSLPHCEFSPREEFIVDVDKTLCNTPLSRTVLKHAGFKADQIENCREIIHMDEHHTVPGKTVSFRDNWNLLVLTYPVSGSHFASSGSISAQLDALDALADPPKEMQDRLAMVIKPHPGEPETELFQALGRGLKEKVCHPKLRLQEMLAGADLVVALNCSYTVIVHTLRQGKPVVFFFTDPFYRDGVGTHQHARLLISAGTMVSNREELWQTVNRFFSEPDFAQALTTKAVAFAQEFLDDSLLPSIGDVVNKCLAAQREVTAEPAPQVSAAIPAIPLRRLVPELENVAVELVDGRQDYGEILPEEVVAICKLARSAQPKRIFEFGTFMGGTTLRLAANTEAEIFTFDLPPQGHPDFSEKRMDDPDLDVYPDTPGVRFLNTPYAQRIHQIYGDSQVFDFSAYFGTMDFVFVDACHHFEFALRDSMNAFKMIRPGGVIVWHDYAEWAPGVMRALKTVSQRYPLFHISGTSLVVYLGEKDAGEGEDITVETETASAQRDDLLARIERSPGDADALVALARLEMDRGNMADALAFVRDALIIEPAHESALSLKAEIEKGL